MNMTSNHDFNKIRMRLLKYYEPPNSINNTNPSSEDTYMEDWLNT